MLAIASVIVVVLTSLIITRVATVILTLTGLSREVARFQARSALSGVGFTTSEAESLVSHPVRRRVVMTLMLVGSAGLVAVISSLVISFTEAGGGQAGLTRLAVLLAGLTALWWLSRSSVVDRVFARFVRRLLRRHTELDVYDYASLLELADGWSVAELSVRGESWLAERTVGDLGLRDEGLALLGIHRPDGSYDGVPVAETRIRPRDTLLLYGPRAVLAELETRPAGEDGDRRHREAARRQGAREVEQMVRDVRSGSAGEG